MDKSKAISIVQIVSAFLIVNYHTSKLAIPILNKIAKCGFIFNTIFVFLSGYLLTKSFSKVDKSSFREFIHKRINRIYPSLHVTLLFITTYYLLTEKSFNFKPALYSFTGFNYFIPIAESFGGGHLWFVSVILICYLLFIPTYKILKAYPCEFLLSAAGMFILIALVKHGSLDGIYHKVSNEVTFRFLYHYIVFSIAIIISLQDIKSGTEILKSKKFIALFFIFFPIYLYLHPNISLSILAIVSVLIVAVSLISILLFCHAVFEDISFPIMAFAPITYELYLIHYVVIDEVDVFFHGKIIGYFLVFIISVILAYLILSLSKSYSRLAKRFTGWLLRIR
jgi:peptidoglycan/LPS O-acetylase OafA/YrhL